MNDIKSQVGLLRKIEEIVPGKGQSNVEELHGDVPLTKSPSEPFILNKTEIQVRGQGFEC
jgi:hypothetical protein